MEAYFGHVQQVHSSWLLEADEEEDDVVEQDGYEDEHRICEASAADEAAFTPVVELPPLLLLPDATLESSRLLLNVLYLFLYKQLADEQPAAAVSEIEERDLH